MAILAVYNHSPETIKSIVTKLGFVFEMWEDSTKSVKENVIYGFSSFSSLLKAKIKTPPILFEAPSTINHVSLNTTVISLDGKRLPDGLIMFHKIDLKRLKRNLSKPFKTSCLKDIIFRKNIQPNNGTTSSLTSLVNNWLYTLPSFTHEPFMVAFASALTSGKWKEFQTLLKENRLVTSKNKQELSALMEKITELKPVVKALVSKDTALYNKELKSLLKADETNIFCVRRVRFYVKYWSTKKIEDYLDAEGNMNYIV